MVVIFGWGADAKDLGEVAPATCPNCHNEVFLHQIRSEKRVSLYFVPLIPYGTDVYLACPICRHALQLRPEHGVAVDRMRAATAVFRRGAVDEARYLATVRQFWARIGVDPSGRQVVGAPTGVPSAPPRAPTAGPRSRAGEPTAPALPELLAHLARMHADGELTDDEFALAKRRVLEG